MLDSGSVPQENSTGSGASGFLSGSLGLAIPRNRDLKRFRVSNPKPHTLGISSASGLRIRGSGAFVFRVLGVFTVLSPGP